MFEKRLGAVALAALASSCGIVVGCTNGEEAPSVLGGEDRAGKLAQKLEADTGVKWVVEADDATHEIRFLMPLGETPSLTKATPEATVKELYAKYAEDLGVTDPNAELASPETTTDEDGMTHLKFEPMLAGTDVPIFDEASLAHVTKDGAIAFLQPSFRHDFGGVAKEATVTPEDAVRQAAELITMACEPKEEATPASEPVLGVHLSSAGKPKLAWRVRFELGEGAKCFAPQVDIDAEILGVLEVRETATALKERQGGARFHLLNEKSDVKEIEVTEDNSLLVTTRWVLSAPSPVPIKTRRYTPFQIIDDPIFTMTQGVWEPNEKARGASIDAHHYMQVTAKYYKQVFGRSSYDGKGSSIVIVSHDNSGHNRNNAYSEPEFLFYGGRFHFGDGDFVVDGQGQKLPFSTGLDVVAHEFTHAVTEHTSKLVYETESGALNESLSDIFGATIENWNPATSNFGANLRMGERVYRNGWGMRDMHAPQTHGQPDHYSRRVPCPNNKPTYENDRCGVHTNSGIPNNAWFLMTHGGVNQTSNIGVDKGIGWSESAKLWYLTNTTLLYPRATFHHAALAQVGQAWWRGGQYLKAVACAWNAVGVLSAQEVGAVGVTCPKATVGCGSYDDAVVCSDVSGFTAYICRGRQIAGAQYCADPNKHCRKTSALDPRAVRNPDGSLTCD